MRNETVNNRLNIERKNEGNCGKPEIIVKEAISYIASCLMAILLFTVVLSINYVPSESMEPTIRSHRFIVNLRLIYLISDPMPDYGAVIVFRENADTNRLLIKRVIGLPGDEISFAGGRVYRNGKEIDEPYLLKQGVSYSAVQVFTVPDGKLFVLGDNRENSNDSRFMEGTYVPIDHVYAKALFQVPF